jgi:hypothetical protein
MIFVTALLAATIAGDPPPKWERLPQPSVYRMANQARAVVEGTPGPNGVVTITARYWVKPGDKVSDAITVPALRTVPQKANAQPDSVLLFLAENTRGDVWVPMHHYGKAARGVIWFENGAAWGYAQAMNPGGYSLMRWGFGFGKQRVLASPKQLRKTVQVGVAARKKWQATLRIADRAERAAALMTWFDPATSPDGEHWQERLWPELMKASGDVGEVIVKPLAHVVQVGAEERAVVAAADALSRFAGRAQKATPALIARLRDLRGVKPIFLLRALERLADPRAAHVLRDYVAHEDLFVATAAAKALKASGGKDVVDFLVQRLPKEIESHEMLGAVAAILEVIHGMQPLVAERLVVERFLGNDQLMKQRTWLRRLRDGLKNR